MRIRNTVIAGLAAVGLAVTAGGASAVGSPGIPHDAVIVSSTDLTGSFTMTVSNTGSLPLDLDLASPGEAVAIAVDTGTYDDTWTIRTLRPNMTATMTGELTG